LFLCWGESGLEAVFMGHKDPRRKLQYANQGRESGWDRKRAAMEDRSRNMDGNRPCQTLPSFSKSGLGRKCQCGPQWKQRYTSEITTF